MKTTPKLLRLSVLFM